MHSFALKKSYVGIANRTGQGVLRSIKNSMAKCFSMGNVVGVQADRVAAAQFAINGRVEQRQVTRLHMELDRTQIA
jgi:hypothetical protein